MIKPSRAVAQLSHEQRVRLEKSLLENTVVSRRANIPVMDSLESFPLTFAQQRLWYLSRIDSQSASYNQMQVMQLSGILDVPALQQSISMMTTRHDSLRLSIREQNGQPVQIIEPLPEFDLTTVSLGQCSYKSQQTTAWRICEQWRSEPFKMEVAPLWRMSLIRFNNNKHWLVRICHHIVSDGWSSGVYWKELSMAYTALTKGLTPEFQSLPIRYVDFAAWQRNWLKGDRLDRLAGYWRQRLAGVETLQLRTDHPRVKNSSTDGKLYVFSLPSPVVDSVYSLAQAHDATPYMVLLTAFQVLLHRYTGQCDIAIGSLVANRTRAETEGLYGLFINALVMRADCTDNPSFAKLLADAKKHTLDAFEHQAFPFEKLVEILNPARDSARNPLFDVLFTLQNTPQNKWKLPELNCERLSTSNLTVKFDLSLAIYETDSGMTCHFEYATALFEDNTIARIARHFNNLLTDIVKNTNRRLSQLSLLDEHEKTQLRFEWNSTAVDHDLSLNLVQLFEQQVMATPNRIALITDEYSVNYKQLNTQANQLAHHLSAVGAKPHNVIGVHLSHSVDVTVALLAIYKIHAVYLPLDASYPAARLSLMLKAANADMLITRDDLMQSLDLASLPRVRLDTDKALIKKSADANLGTTTHPEELAYIVFTSGSTSMPKGVCASHKQILNRLHWMWRSYPFSEADVSCQKTAISFVDSIWELLGPLLMGSPSVVLNEISLHNSDEFLDSLRRHNVSRLWAVPTLLQVLVDCASKSKYELPALDMIVSSGENLSGALAAKVRNTWPHARLFNLYGSSEAWDSLWHETTPEDECALNVPVGKPIDNVQVHILDTYLNQVPIGVVGQLYVSGAGLANCFIGKENDGFIGQPWEDKIDAPEKISMHASGDRARLRENGVIELVGRENSDLNVRGYRVNPAEIEQALMSQAEIDQAAIIQWASQGHEQVLVAFVTLHNRAIALNDNLKFQLRSQLKRKLANYMLPNHYIYLAKLPTTPSGKLDRRALFAEVNHALLSQGNRDCCESEKGVAHIGWGKLDKSKGPHAFNSELEQRILKIWASVLPDRPIGVDDDFFEIGGHSLLAVELFRKLENIADIPRGIASLYDASTVAEQAQLISRLTIDPEPSKVVTIKADGQSDPIYLIPPALGTGLNYRHLAACVGGNHPIFTFNLASTQIADIISDGDLHTEITSEISIEAIAQYFVSELIQKHPRGPYVLGGVCFGGLIAWEMARQLQNAGAKVNYLILMDSSLPIKGPTWQKTKSNFGPLQAVVSLAQQVIVNRASLKSLGRVSSVIMHKLMRPWSPHLREIRSKRLAYWKAFQHYEGKPLKVDALIVVSSEFERRKDYLRNWKTLIQGRSTIKVLSDATHRDMLTDHHRHKSYTGKLIRNYLNPDADEKKG